MRKETETKMETETELYLEINTNSIIMQYNCKTKS